MGIANPVLELRSLEGEFLTVRRTNDYSPRTIEMYKTWFGKMHAAGLNTLDSLNSLGITRFYSTLRDAGLAQYSRKQADACLRCFVGWLYRIEAITKNPFDREKGGVEKIRLDEKLPDPATDTEVKALLAACAKSWEGIRNRAMVLVMADCGLRRGEVLGLTIRRFNAQDQMIHILKSKTHTERYVPVSDPTIRAVRRYLELRPRAEKDGLLFTDRRERPLQPRHLTEILYRLSTRAKLPRKIHPHQLRHFCATEHLRAGMPIAQVQKLMGHKRIEQTLAYCRLLPEDVLREHEKASVIEGLGIR